MRGMMSPVALFSCSFIFWACSGGPSPQMRCDAAVVQGLTNAQQVPGLPLSPSQQAAIGALRTPADEVRCSGTLIADRWVLSANHCSAPAGLDHPLVFRTSVDGGEIALPVVARFAHPELDAMLFEVPTSSSVQAGSVQPLGQWSATDGAPWLGQTLTLAGFGDTEDGSDGARLFLEEPVVEVQATSLVVDGGSEHGACDGDSGGPLLAVAPDQSIRIVGLLSEGNATCRGQDRYIRTDVLSDWISQVQEQRGQSPCAGLSWEGVCADGRATWCAMDHIEATDCTHHQLCGWDAAQSGYRCVDAAEDPCRGAGPSGYCEGDTLRVCRRGELMISNCAACGARCEWDLQGAACR